MEVDRTSLYKCLIDDMKRLSYRNLRLVATVVYTFLKCEEEKEANN